MNVSTKELASYRTQIEESNLSDELKEQALLGIAKIEEAGGHLELAVSQIPTEYDISDRLLASETEPS